MRVCIHRGAKEIGGSCVEVAVDGKRLIIDLGVPLDAEKNDKKYLPDIPGLDGRDDSLLAILISHPHIDHFGLLNHVSSSIPVMMGADARRIITKASPFLPGNWPTPFDGPDLVSGLPIALGPFTITPFLTDHSGYDAYSLMIEADNKRVFYSGDFRMHGRKGKLTEGLLANPPERIDVLLLEGSTLGRSPDGAFPSERQIEHQLIEKFRATPGMALVHASSQNIDRIVSIFRACKQADRRLVIDLYAAAVLEATGNPNIPQSDWPEVALYIPQRQRVQIKNNRWFDLLTKHSRRRIFIERLEEIKERCVLLFRPIHIPDLERSSDLLEGAHYIYSQWEGYWERDSNAYLREWLARHRIPKASIHTSGHASPADLQRFAEALRPAKIVPIHTIAPERYPELFHNVQSHADGEYWEV